MPERTRRSGNADTGSGSGARLGDPDRRTLLKTTAAGAATVSVAGCLETVGSITGGSGSEDPITIGALAPNPDSDYIGRGIVRGAQVAVDEINESGGILGRDVELATGDTNRSPTEARRQYQRLVLEEDADVTVGIFDSPSLETVIEDIAEQETIHLTTGAATSAVSRKVSENYDRYKYHFRVGPTNDRDLGNALIDFLDTNAERIGWNSVAVLVEDYPWSEGPWDVMQDQLDDVGVGITMDQRYPPATNDFTDMYTDVAESGADAAFVGMAHTGTTALMSWAGRQFPFAFGGIHVPMQLPNYWELTGGACQSGISLISATANSEVGDLTQRFVSAYENEYGSTPVYTGYTSYEAVKLYAHVVGERETQSTDELIPALEDVSFEGATGTVEFYDADHQFAHDLTYKPQDNLYMQWQADGEGGGTQEVIWPEEHRTSEYVSPHWL